MATGLLSRCSIYYLRTLDPSSRPDSGALDLSDGALTDDVAGIQRLATERRGVLSA